MVTGRVDLEQMGFDGFVPFRDLPVSDVPAAVGVYAVLRPAETSVSFLPASTAGWSKGRDPSVSHEVLGDAWVDGVEVIYFGKAGGRGGLRGRLSAYRRHGAGSRAAHWGGRYIWQLADAGQLLVAWKLTPDERPEAVEAALIATFVKATGLRPFANRNRGQATASGR